MQNRVGRLAQLVVMGAMATMLTGFDGGGCGGGFEPPPQGCPAVACDASAGCRPELNADGCAFCVCERPPPPPPDRCAGLDERSCVASPGCQPIYDAGPAPRPNEPEACMPAPSYAGCESKGRVCSDVMCALWCENGFKTDADGCPICACKESACASDNDCAPDEYCDFSGGRAVPPCPPGAFCDVKPDAGVCRPNQACDAVMCNLYCEYGFQRDPATGCAICACNPPPLCPEVLCGVYCEYGHKRDAMGCDTCECNPPPQCQPVLCKMYCPYGWATDPSTGCEICACAPPPSGACLSDSDCRPGQECQWPPTCAGLNCPQPTAGHCTDVTCSSDADCGPGSSCQPDPNDPCSQPGVVCTMEKALRMICLPKPPPPPPGCTTDADCGPGQRCEPGVTCTALGCPPPVNMCVDNTCRSDRDCSGGTTCQPDPTDPCNQPNVLCFAPGRTVCLPPPPSGCAGLDERACLARADCQAVYGPSTCSPDGSICTTDMVFKGCK